ncbi:hypothetical protein Glo7428_2907 [Gloeocapsa sp. PCC 7428]|nr:hypothetical protein Glo7428_2907 [Gloeocapsa sp. PCC 7428]
MNLQLKRCTPSWTSVYEGTVCLSSPDFNRRASEIHAKGHSVSPPWVIRCHIGS